jgi:hypothetical protein
MAETFDQFEKRNRELFLWLFLFQSYLQGIKARFANEYSRHLAVLLAQFTQYINAVRYETLDGFRKAELRQFIWQLKEAEAGFYSKYVNELIAQLQAFVEVDQDAATKIYEAAFTQSVGEAEEARAHGSHRGITAATEPQTLWSVIKNTPVGATGMYPVEMINEMALTHLKKTNALIQRAYVNGWDKPTLITAFRDQFAIFNNQAATNTSTVIQHAHAITNLAVGSIFLAAYMWCSILDEKTTDFCIEHNGNVYQNGKGPVPPGHYGCRAHTMPVVAVEDNIQMPTQSAYVGTLAVSIQDMIRGISATRPLTDDQFRAKIVSFINK